VSEKGDLDVIGNGPGEGQRRNELKNVSKKRKKWGTLKRERRSQKKKERWAKNERGETKGVENKKGRCGSGGRGRKDPSPRSKYKE